MTAYFITWAVVFCLALTAGKNDYRFPDKLSFVKIKHTSRARVYYAMATLVLIFVAGCRYYIGSDYYAYYGWYHSYAGSLTERIRTLNEPVISLIYSVVIKVCDDGFACVFALGAVIIWLATKTLRDNTTDISLAIILYSVICWVASFNGMRQVLATSVIFFGFPYLRDKKLIKYSICVFLAYLCHKSAAICILLFVAVHRKVNIKNIFFLVIITISVVYSYDKVFAFTNTLLDKEVETGGAYISRSVNLLRVASNVAPAIVFSLIWWNRPRTEAHDFYLNFLFIHAAISLMTLNSAYLARLNIYTEPFEIIAICELLKGNIRNKQLLRLGIVVLFLLFQLYEVHHSADLSPFRWIWSRGGSYYGL